VRDKEKFLRTADNSPLNSNRQSEITTKYKKMPKQVLDKLKQRMLSKDLDLLKGRDFALGDLTSSKVKPLKH